MPSKTGPGHPPRRAAEEPLPYLSLWLEEKRKAEDPRLEIPHRSFDDASRVFAEQIGRGDWESIDQSGLATLLMVLSRSCRSRYDFPYHVASRALDRIFRALVARGRGRLRSFEKLQWDRTARPAREAQATEALLYLDAKKEAEQRRGAGEEVSTTEVLKKRTRADRLTAFEPDGRPVTVVAKTPPTPPAADEPVVVDPAWHAAQLHRDVKEIVERCKPIVENARSPRAVRGALALTTRKRPRTRPRKPRS